MLSISKSTVFMAAVGGVRSRKRDAQQAKVDVFDEGHELVIIAELPGAREDEIMVETSGSSLHIGTPLVRFRHFWGKAELACPVTESHHSHRNGILELHFLKAHNLDPDTPPEPLAHRERAK
jgi:HSP20 family molecular chaperone IbpA